MSSLNKCTQATINQELQPPGPGYFGQFGGQFVPETLMFALEELEAAYNTLKNDPAFQSELTQLYQHYSGRPTPVYFAERLSQTLGGPKIYLKREDLNHTGSHKLNNALGQGLIARRLGKQRLVAETGAGQHGVATATVAAMLGLSCDIYMGEEDTIRQAHNVFRMELLGAKVIPVTTGTKTLKDAINEALRDWTTHVETTHYLIGSVIGPHPYPTIVRDFQSVIGKEARSQILEMEGRLPDYVVACVGGGSNAMGIFYPFINDTSVALVGVEAAGTGLDTGKHSASLAAGSPGILHGTYTMLLQDTDGQVLPTHSIAAGLDYPGVGPEHAYLKSSGRAIYTTATDAEALDAFHLLCKTEGIIPALESAHAIAWVVKNARLLSRDQIVLVCLSGRGDKDLNKVLEGAEIR